MGSNSVVIPTYETHVLGLRFPRAEHNAHQGPFQDLRALLTLTSSKAPEATELQRKEGTLGRSTELTPCPWALVSSAKAQGKPLQ